MQEVCKFISEYWKLIVSGCLLIVALVVSLIRKKPILDFRSWVYKGCIEAVKLAESAFKPGQGIIYHGVVMDKLNYAYIRVKEFLNLVYPDLDVDLYKGMIITIIEEILTTPQKKGE